MSDGRSGVGREGRTDVPCRLLYLVGQLRAGGLERQLVYLLGKLDSDLYRPEVAVWNFAEEDVHVASIRRLQVPLHAAPVRASRVRKLMWFRGLVRRLRPEVVHSYSFFTNFAAWFGCWGLGAVVVGSRRSNLRRETLNAGLVVGMLGAHWPRTQICNSFAAAEQTRKDGGFFSPKRLLVVRNGIDLSLFRPSPYAASRPVEIVAVGSLIPVKRWDRLLRTADLLRRQGMDFRVRLAGDGPLRGKLERQARHFGLEEVIHFQGYTSNVQALLDQSSFLVHTSDVEGCPNVVMEAMAAGRAVIATDAGETPSLVENGKTGFVVPRGDDALLVERIATLIRDGDLCRKMGEAARIKAEREFGLERLVAETLAAYRTAGWNDNHPGMATS